MSNVKRFLGSSIGSKVVMAVTGLLLFGFLLGHILGNFLIYSGPEAFNAYAHGLKNLPFGAIWIARIGLLAIVTLHFATGIRLNLRNRAARPEPYRCQATIQASLASRSMIWTGLVLMAFIVYHILHFTLYLVNNPVIQLDAMGRADTYGMVIEGFRQPAIALSYVVAMVFLGIHLSHGLSSALQTLGLQRNASKSSARIVAPVISAALSLAFISIPVAIWLGIVGS